MNFDFKKKNFKKLQKENNDQINKKNIENADKKIIYSDPNNKKSLSLYMILKKIIFLAIKLLLEKIKNHKTFLLMMITLFLFLNKKKLYIQLKTFFSIIMEIVNF